MFVLILTLTEEYYQPSQLSTIPLSLIATENSRQSDSHQQSPFFLTTAIYTVAPIVSPTGIFQYI